MLDQITTKPKLHFQRFEFKYLISPEMVEPIKKDLQANNMKIDPHIKSANDSYEVRSLYYDTLDLKAYWEKEAGIKTRKKHRLRVYSKDESANLDVFLEIKGKQDMFSKKDRILTKWENAVKLLKGLENDPLKYFPSEDKEMAEKFFFDYFHYQLRPTVLVVYNRTPFINDYDEKFRVTFDANIRAAKTDNLFYDDIFEPVLTTNYIMEVKFNNTLAFWFHQIIQKYELNRGPFSKYFNGMDAAYFKNQSPIKSTHYFTFFN